MREIQKAFSYVIKYALNIISEVGLLGVKPANISMESKHKLALAEGSPLANPERYRQLVGHLLYLRFTRTELSYWVLL